MKNNNTIKTILFIVILFVFPAVSLAQVLADKAKQEIELFLTGVIREQTAIRPITIDSIAADTETISLFASRELSFGRFDRTMTDNIYARIRSSLPADFRQRQIELYSDGYKIEEYIPLSREERFTNQVDVPLKARLSNPFSITKGLHNRHIALWQSHGWHYNQTKERWEWQRPRLFQSVEDLLTQSFVFLFSSHARKCRRKRARSPRTRHSTIRNYC